MAGVFKMVMVKDIPRNRRLMLQSDWERDECLIEGETDLDGSLPGAGVTFYTLMIEDEGSREIEKVLQEFRFKGGGDLRGTIVPPRPKAAFDEWYEKLMKDSN